MLFTVMFWSYKGGDVPAAAFYMKMSGRTAVSTSEPNRELLRRKKRRGGLTMIPSSTESSARK